MKRTALDISTASSLRTTVKEPTILQMSSAKLQSKLILRDTMGLTQAARLAQNGSEGSSSTSSIKELSAADEKGLNRSFRAIQMAKYGANPRVMDRRPLIEEEAPFSYNASEENPVSSFDIAVDVLSSPQQTHGWNSAGLRTEPIRIIDDQANTEGRGTPSSTASSHSGQRVIFGKDGTKRTFSPPAIQIGKSMRDIIRDQARQPPVETNHVGGPVPSGSSEETSMKTPYHEMEISTVESSHWDRSDLEKNEDESKGNARCLLKCTILGLCLAILVAAMVLLIYFFKDNDTKGAKPIILPDTFDPECPLVHEVKFRENILFNCAFQTKARTKLVDISTVEIIPPPYYKKGKTIVTKVSERTGDWSYNWNKTNGKMEIFGPSATCSSSGLYTVSFKNRSNATLHTVDLELEVKSEVSKVNVNLTQQKLDQEEKQFWISCSTNSGCQQAFVDFFAEINKTETKLRGVNFSCEITYDDINGYSVSCEGVIPDFLMHQFRKITCRPSSELLGDADDVKKLEENVKLPTCNISNNCGYKCDTTYSEDYYIVDKQRCDIFHRCYQNNAYSSFCSPGTFFNPGECTCDHSKMINWCRSDGLNYNLEGKKETWCDVSIQTTQHTTVPTEQTSDVNATQPTVDDKDSTTNSRR